MKEQVYFRVVDAETGALIGVSSSHKPLVAGDSVKMSGTGIEYTIQSISIEPDPMEFSTVVKV
jgi:hypothetical protein